MTNLTPRQREVLALVATGCTNAEIAARLGIEAETVNSHLKRAYERLGIAGPQGRIQAAVWWTQRSYTTALLALAGTEAGADGR